MGAVASYLAIDLGASSGRAVVGSFDGARLGLREVHRFANGPVAMPTGLHWDTPRLFGEVCHALAAARRAGVALESVGIDTWGVDYGLLAASGELLGLPHHYRDPRTQGMIEEASRRVSRERIYARTGIQFLALNTLYQLLADQRCGDGRLRIAKRLLFTPDLLHFWLTGVMACERTIASTSQLLDTGTGAWAEELIGELGLPRGVFGEVVGPGHRVGALRLEVAEETAVGAVAVVAPASHDTASAVAAVPVTGDGWAYISSGTWSLVGRELPAPIRTREAMEENFTNECGVGGTIRFHKNVAGLWLLQECQRVWSAAGRGYSHEQLVAMAGEARAFAALVDPDDASFAEFGDMPGRIRASCAGRGEPVPGSDGAVVRCALESLALKYRMVIESLERVTGRPVGTIHIVGGGSSSAMLCQFTADATGRVVLAGPVEATAAGNAMVQAMASGRVGSLAEIRAVVAASFRPVVYEPGASGARGAWDAAYERFRRVAG